MQLSKLEIKGFKSFGDKVTVHFDDGITGIVGPNGCGKSNIVDAIRWVLGEQKTKALRSDKMENVIFNGTKKRKALQMAEVSISFNNTKNLLPTEYSQVTITRKYYRSGESEYLLNGVSCRLKDITNLFLDTGIGTNSYAIIELKMVDEILNDKDNSRRQLFEEAAGISKFKVRKKQTLKKLEDTDKDLDRVEDLLYEIEKNLKNLEKQAKQADKYIQIKEEYKKYSVAQAKLKLSDQQELLELSTKRLEEENTRKTELIKFQKSTDAEIEKLKKELILKEKTVTSRQKSLSDHTNAIRNYESEKKIKNERLRYLNDRNVQLKDLIKTDKDNTSRFESEIKQLEEDKFGSNKQTEDLEYALGKLKTEVELQKERTQVAQNEINFANENFHQEQERIFQLKKSIEVNEIQLTNLKEEFAKTSSDTTLHTENIDAISKNREAIANQLKLENKELEKLFSEEKRINTETEKTEAAIEKTKEELSKVNRQIDSKENEYNLTKSLVDNLEGFPEAIKFLKKSDWGKDIPLLSDLLTCDEKYRVAIENYLEPVMNYYVVDNENQAYQAIKLLGESAMGKANFFVLDSISKAFKADKAKTITNTTHAIDLLEYDDKYIDIINYVLNDVYLLDENLENAPEDKHEVFLSQSGKLTKRKFSLTGGSVGLFEGKRIGRAKNLEKLQDKIKSLSTTKDKISVQLEKGSNTLLHLKSQKIHDRIDEKKIEINELNEEYIKIKMKQEQLDSMIQNNTVKKEDILQNITILETGLEKSKPNMEIENTKLDSLKEKMESLTKEVENQREILNQNSQRYNQENINFHQQKNKINSILSQIEYKQEALGKSFSDIEKNEKELASIDGEIKKLIEKNETNDDQLVSMYEEKESIEKGVNEIEKEFYDTRGQISEKEDKLREYNRSRENSDTLILELQNTLNQTKLSLNSVKERLSVEFNVDLNQLLINSEEEVKYSPSELEVKVAQCKDRIQKMGPINPMAKEAYDEIKERFEFITSQKADLAEAKKSLIKTISEIDIVAKENFVQAFEDIKENFINVFRKLFTDEDKCDLKLVDPDNPLDSKIEIMAKPKGKRPLTINQLSGGEKTLTAVALLFAIYLIKPASFCIFDEVDAPLDDANIDKFNNIIRDFSQESQFILVTHNKRTMSTTDIIYGVTMQEEGVSKLVPVDLRSLN